MLENREEAARLLAGRLEEYRGRKPLVMAVPRGGVPMGRILADALEGDLDVVLVHKVGAPGNPELAIGAVDERGMAWLSPLVAHLEIPPSYLEEEIAAQVNQLQLRRAEYAPGRPPADPGGRLVIIVDDGVATGATMLAALRLLREARPERLMVAVGVAPRDTFQKLSQQADACYVIEVPEEFRGVGEFYRDFRQVTDEEVIRALAGKEAGQGTST